MTLRKIFFLFFLLVRIMMSWSQDSSAVQKKSDQSIEITGTGFINSNTINNDFISAIYNGRFIDSIMKLQASDKLLTSNRLGGAAKLGLTYSYHSLEGNHKPIFYFSFFDRTHLDMKFSDDLFYTLFYGNKMFSGNTSYLGNFSLNFLRYQQFAFGWDWKGDYSHGSYGFACSLLSGEQNIFIKAPTADLFTADDGTYMDFLLDMQVQQSDTSQKKFFSQNGSGLSTDFYYEMPYEFWKRHGRITFEVKDLGFIRWNSNSMQYNVDSSYHYDGIDVSDIFNIDSNSTQFTVNSVIDKNTSFKKGAYTTKIPCTFDVHTKSYYGTKVAIEKGIVWWFNTSAKAYYYAKLHFIVGRKTKTDFAYTIGYGGYGRFNAGLEAKVDFAKKYSFYIADNYIFSGQAQVPYGQGLCLKLVRKF